jgi:hypothetical protein
MRCPIIDGDSLFLIALHFFRRKAGKNNSKLKGAIRRKKLINLTPGKMKACRSISTTLLQSVAKIGTQRTMKSTRKTFLIQKGFLPRRRMA